MAAIANRYVLRETAQTWLVVTAVLLLILVTTQFATVLSDAASNRLPKDALLIVTGLTSLQNLRILIPVGLFFSILLAMGRLYRDSEMYALMACGFGPGELYRPLMVFASVLALVVGAIALDGSPRAFAAVVRIMEEARSRSDLSLVEAGRFVGFDQSDGVAYAEQVTADGRLRNVFVQRRLEAQIEVIVAEEGHLANTADPGIKALMLDHGRRYEGVPGSAQFRITEFEEARIPYALPAPRTLKSEPEARSLSALLQSSDISDVAELQWRLSAPIMVLVLGFLAVPLGRSAPRKGRYAGLGVGVLVFINYALLLAASKVWLERGKVSPMIGMWWVHVLFVVVGLLLLNFQYKVLRLSDLFSREPKR